MDGGNAFAINGLTIARIHLCRVLFAEDCKHLDHHLHSLSPIDWLKLLICHGGSTLLADQEQASIINERKSRVLIVDNDTDLTTSFQLGLQQHGFQVDIFNNPVLAASSYKAASYDLLLLDIWMPLMDGFTLYKEIRRIDNEVKVCFIIAYEINNEDF